MAVIYMPPDYCNSSLIKEVYYDTEVEELTVVFHKYFCHSLVYGNIDNSIFIGMHEAESVGKFYLTYIKPNFKHKQIIMSEEKKGPKGVNNSSDKKRFIKMRLNVQEIKKEWLFAGKSGTYLDITLMLLPDGEVDRYENLGMVVQDVPQEVYKADKKAQGPILGNGKELQWTGGGDNESNPGSGSGSMVGDNAESDDLPF